MPEKQIPWPIPHDMLTAKVSQSSAADPLLVFWGYIRSFEESGGGPNSRLFSFYADDPALREGYSFCLRSDTPPDMFTAMASTVVVGWSVRRTDKLQMVCYERLSSGVFLVSLIRGGT